jgi:antitoxin ParD1/3/4
MEKMSNSLNLSLTDELKRFIQSQLGEGTLFSTPSEYVRDLIRHEKERKEASELRSSIIEGYQDAISGKTVKFSGDLKADLKKYGRSK